MRTKRLLAISIVLTSLSLLSLATTPVYAHERRDVTIAGKTTRWVVGWGVEPAFVDQMNLVSLSVTDTSTSGPVYGLQVLRVNVTTGPAFKVLNLTRVFGEDGEYKAEIMPTVSGTYSFRFFGNANNTDIDQTFVCNQPGVGSQGAFDCVEPLSDAQFPVQTPSQRDIDTSLDNLASRLDQALQLASIIGGVGIAVGAAGILVGVAAYRRKPRNT